MQTAATTTTVPPFDLGQLVAIDSYDERLPGTVVAVRPVGLHRWEVRVEVLASFGIGVSRHVVDDLGRELERRGARLGLAETATPVRELAAVG
jgi:hypothetical protein